MNKQQTEPSNKGQVVSFVRALLYVLLLVLFVASLFYQDFVLNWETLFPSLGIICLGLFLHVIWQQISGLSERTWFRLITFLIDTILINFLILKNTNEQSLFLFLHLVNILLAGLSLQSRGALFVALFTSIGFTTVSLLGPELKALQTLLLLGLNNISFFIVAGVAGYLSDLLKTTGEALFRTDRSLRSLEVLNQIVLNNMPAALASFSRDGEILQTNELMLEFFPSAQVGKNLKESLPTIPWLEVDQVFDRVKSIWRGDLHIPVGSFESKTYGVTVAVAETPHLETSLGIALVEDLTLVRGLEDRLRHQEKLAAVGQLAAGIAHEIRNPLAGISGSVEMLSQTTSNEEDKKLMKIILREIDRLNNLITEFLDYARPDSRPTDKVDLVALCNEVLESMKLNTKLRQDVKIIFHHQAEATIRGRRDKLKQALLNIVINAYQAMEKSTEANLEISLRVDSDEVELVIKDSGSGMKEETLKRMFEPFHTTKPKGTGLGLAITHKILQNHEAQVDVLSKVGVGTEFRIRFPKLISN